MMDRAAGHVNNAKVRLPGKFQKKEEKADGKWKIHCEDTSRCAPKTCEKMNERTNEYFISIFYLYLFII